MLHCSKSHRRGICGTESTTGLETLVARTAFWRGQMIKRIWVLAAALCCFAPPDGNQVAAEELQGSAFELACRSNPAFPRKMHAWGVVVGSLTASTEAAGVPPAAMTAVLQALRTTIDPVREVRSGDLFWMQYEQEYTVEGDPIGNGRVLWAELHTAAKGTIAIHRFHIGESSDDPFWLATGQSTATAAIDLPLDRINITSGFGMRADPINQPTSSARVTGHVRVSPSGSRKSASTPGTGTSRRPAHAGGTKARTGAGLTPLGLSMGLSAAPTGGAAPPSGGASRAIARHATFVMHQGIDLAAEPGTPVYAAADGAIVEAASGAGYGNWIAMEHHGKLSTLYGHLSSFAPGIAAGVRVQRGGLIGFVGNTGRSTGPHLHFELMYDGKPVDPIAHQSMTTRLQLSNGDLERFREVVARNLADAQLKGKPK
jgi:murein DD-endopeptidase MepM/ murein hydrolase activator NlpD